jgi:hypothetical protein
LRRSGRDPAQWRRRARRPTGIVRKTGNLKHAQTRLRHSDIGTTITYAHVTHDDLMEAMERTMRAPEAFPSTENKE